MFDINKVLADIKAKRAAQLAAKSGQPLPQTNTQKSKSTGSFGKKKTWHTKSLPAKSKAPSARTSKRSASQATLSQSKLKHPDSLPSSAASTTSTAKSEISNGSENAIEASIESHQANVSQAPKQDETPSVTTTSSEDSRSASEKQQGFAGILMAMIEVQKNCFNFLLLVI